MFSFFFSSRRRHTRWPRDWSSDVCSSDLGNAAKDGKAAAVFAQLITKNVNYGVHAFFVPMRDDDGNFLPGGGGEDDGFKGGLIGMDSGRLHFTRVWFSRTSELEKLGDVD